MIMAKQAADMTNEELYDEFYHPAPYPYPARTDELREEIRNRVDTVKSN